MKIPSIQAYRDTTIINDDYIQSSREVNNGVQIAENNEQSGNNNYNPNNIITKKERDFFIKLFPENSDQLERHVLFNSQGKLQTQTFSKGLIIDGIV